MIGFSTKYRSRESEIMDDFNLQGQEMKTLLTDLKNVNKWLGGNAITINGITQLLQKKDRRGPVTIVDIGCGDGEMLREIARFGIKKGLDLNLIGVDANEFIISEAKVRSKEFLNLSFRQVNVFSEELDKIEFDIALCTLFLHHFSNSEIVHILNRLHGKAKVGIVVNDLERSFVAFWLFRIAGAVFLKTKIARHDGLVSVARGFRRGELLSFSEKIKNCESRIRWKWAFRFQWILTK
jgi:hypothetical protein